MKIWSRVAAGGVIVKRVQEGATADLVLLPRPALERLMKGGKLAAGSESRLVRSGIGVSVRKGAPRPDISSPEALKRTLLDAKSITCSKLAKEVEAAKALINFLRTPEAVALIKTKGMEPATL